MLGMVADIRFTLRVGSNHFDSRDFVGVEDVAKRVGRDGVSRSSQYYAAEVILRSWVALAVLSHERGNPAPGLPTARGPLDAGSRPERRHSGRAQFYCVKL